MEIRLYPIAIVKNSRRKPTDDFWEEIISEIELADHISTERFDNISVYSHLDIIYYVNLSGEARGSADYLIVSIFDKEKKDMLNTIGFCTVRLLKHTGRTIKVKYLKAVNGTPVLDIKPVISAIK